jgi:hypothetical protein
MLLSMPVIPLTKAIRNRLSINIRSASAKPLVTISLLQIFADPKKGYILPEYWRWQSLHGLYGSARLSMLHRTCANEDATIMGNNSCGGSGPSSASDKRHELMVCSSRFNKDHFNVRFSW